MYQHILIIQSVLISLSNVICYGRISTRNARIVLYILFLKNLNCYKIESLEEIMAEVMVEL
jgi:hypothetical protein